MELKIPVEQFRSLAIKMYYFGGRDLPTDEDALNEITPAGTGSAFFYRFEGKLYIVTARHCFSARNWETGDYLPGSHSVEPTHLALLLRRRPPGGRWDLRGSGAPAARMLIPLLDQDGTPIWFEHPRAGAGMDVAVLLVPDSIANDESLLIESYSPPSTDGDAPNVVASVAQDVFVIGYPYGLESGFMMPLWIRGTIASEPVMYYPHRGQDLPLLLIDARTREGQSGAPAILYRQPLTPVYTNSGTIGMTQAGFSRILGVYSGRTSPDSDLGFVWRIEQVDVICREAKRARLDHSWPLTLDQIPLTAPEDCCSSRDSSSRSEASENRGLHIGHPDATMSHRVGT